MALIKRSVKGTNLTPTEVDANFQHLSDLIIDGSITYTDIIWTDLVALGTRAQGDLYNITDAHPTSGDVYGKITLLNDDYFHWINASGLTEVITII